MSLGTIDNKNVVLSFGGVLISGFAEDDHIEIERMEATYKAKAGVDGQVARTKTGNRMGTVKVKLQQTSLSNDFLSASLILDENTPGGIVLPLLIDDLNTGSQYIAAQAWLERPTKAQYGSSPKDREWTFHCAEINMLTNGNAI